jgi:hypothetical protein
MPGSMPRQVGDENPDNRNEWAHTLASAVVRALQARALGEYMRVLVLVLAVALVAMAAATVVLVAVLTVS